VIEMDRYMMGKLIAVSGISRAIGPRLPYHNNCHIEDVYRASIRYARLEGLDQEQTFILGTAALMHDVIYIPSGRYNEDMSCEVSTVVLGCLGYTVPEIKEVNRLISSTKMPTRPSSLDEKILCDADLDILGGEEFWDRQEQLRIELGIERIRWYREIEPGFLSRHVYYTESARRLRQAGVQANLERILRYEVV
jgi:predicted metal-dependent HD superfamily phosphohydrolase